MSEIIGPPPALLGGRVTAYAIVDDSVVYIERHVLFVDGKALGRVPRLAICEERNSDEYLVLHCDERWEPLGIGGASSEAAAKRGLARSYPGIESKWVDPTASEREVQEYLEHEFGDETCSFCGRGPRDIDTMLKGEAAYICNFCIMELHEFLTKNHVE